jgi:hypothetical protein
VCIHKKYNGTIMVSEKKLSIPMVVSSLYKKEKKKGGKYEEEH